MNSRADREISRLRMIVAAWLALLVLTLAGGQGRVVAAAQDGDEADYLDSLAAAVASDKLVHRLGAGDVIPDFSLGSLQGGPAITRSSVQGAPTVLLFFGLDNESRKERSFALLTILQKMHATHGDAIRFFGICSDPAGCAASVEYARTQGMEVPLLDDSGRTAYTLFGIFMMPEILVVTPDGHLDAKIPFSSTAEEQLSLRLRVALGEIFESDMQQELHIKAPVEHTPEEKKFRRRLNLARVMARRKMYRKAIAEFGAAAALQPRDPAPLTEMGFVQLTMQEWEGAIATFDKVLEMDPDSMDAVGGLGLALHGAGRDDEALPELLDAVVVLRPKPLVLIGLAEIYTTKGQKDQALAMYHRAVTGLLAELERGRNTAAAGD